MKNTKVILGSLALAGALTVGAPAAQAAEAPSTHAVTATQQVASATSSDKQKPAKPQGADHNSYVAKCALGTIGGALSGIFTGATAGTVFGPGVGNIVGAVIGGLGGGISGGLASCLPGEKNAAK